jgi:hypothetical protein
LIGEATTGPISWLVEAGTHIGFGFGLFYGITRFFEEVEKSLNDLTKLEIVVWVLDLKPSQPLASEFRYSL